MARARYVKFRDIESSVLQIIKSSRRGADLSALEKWGQETGCLSQTRHKNGRVMTMLRLICDNCGARTEKHLYLQRKALKQGSRDSYCSAKCRDEHHSFKNSKMCEKCRVYVERHERFCGEHKPPRGSWLKKAPRICKQCGAEFPRCGSSRQYCTARCADTAHSLRMSGSRNSKYRGRGMAQYSNLFRKMRHVILARDGYACASCAAPAKRIRRYRPRISLQVHHIDENTRNNRPQNLITLCEHCHATHHVAGLPISGKLSEMATQASMSMTSRLKARAATLLMEYLSTTA